MRIKLEDVCVIVVDYQEKFVPAIAEWEQLVANSRKLLQGLQILGVPVVVTTQYAKGLGMTVPEIAEVAGTEESYDKKSYSVYGDAVIKDKIDSLGKKQVILCGIETHICVLQSALDLLENGYQPILVEDCVSSRRLSDKNTALQRARVEGVTITTYESLLFELLGTAEHENFKQISNLVK